MEQTYGDVWDRYVAEAFPKLKSRTADRNLAHPGDEWGSERSWKSIFAKLFEASDVANWKYAIEIGGGGGKYTELVLRAADDVTLFGFDVSRNFLDSTAARLPEFVSNGRLSLNQIDSVHPDMMMSVIEQAGAVRKVDAMFSIDAMVHVDLQYLTTYWTNAAQVLRPGGRILMTIADPTSKSGFQKIRRDIRKFYKFQGRMCPKFEYLSEEIVRAVLGELGFDIVCLEQWSYFEGRPARDLYLIAELARPEQADKYRDWIRADPAHSNPVLAAESETFHEMWDRDYDHIRSGASTAPRAASSDTLAALLPAEALSGATNIVEIGGGETALTASLMAMAPAASVLEFTLSDKAEHAYHEAFDATGDRFALARFDQVEPDGLLRECDTRGLTRKIDAFVSLNVFQHIDLQYMFSYLVNAALVLKPGGKLVFNTGDASSAAGVQKLLSDIRVYFAYQGRACPRFEYQSPSVLRHMLTEMGFDIDVLEHWTPGGDIPARDLHVVATMARPEMAEQFRGDISIGLLLSLGDDTDPKQIAARKRIDRQMSEASIEEQDMARALGQTYWRQVTIQANPGISKEDMKAKLSTSWGGARRDYTRLGFQVLRALRSQGYDLTKGDVAAAASDDDA